MYGNVNRKKKKDGTLYKDYFYYALSLIHISVTQGHEVSGEITELGKNVTEFHVGPKVTIEPQVYCGHCYPCLLYTSRCV